MEEERKLRGPVEEIQKTMEEASKEASRIEQETKHFLEQDVYKRQGLKSDNDEDALRATIEQIVKDNPQSVEDYHNGKETVSYTHLDVYKRQGFYCKERSSGIYSK